MEKTKITLKAARVNSGYTQKELAKLLSKSETTIIKWEKNPKKMPIEYFEKICKVLKISPDIIFFGD